MEMLTKKQTEILNLFRKNIFLKKTIREISLVMKKAYPKTYEAVKILEKNKILNLEKVGSSSVISLNLSRESVSFMAFLDERETLGRNIPNSEKITELKELSDYLVLITGSYAKGTPTKKSDMDLVVIVPDNVDVVKIQGIIENRTMLFIPEIHLYVFNKKDFVSMLIDKKENYGREIFRKHIILQNAHNYYNLLKEAVDNGFKG